MLCAAVKDRSNYDQLRSFDAAKTFRADGPLSAVWDALSTYYRNDAEATSCNEALLLPMALEHCVDDKQRDVVRAVLSSDVLPTVNVVESLQAAKRARLRLEMADALLSHDDAEYADLQAQYLDLARAKVKKYELSTINTEDLLKQTGKKIPIAPAALNKALGGGMERGEVLLIFGRPGAAKTLECINVVYGGLHAGHKVLYIGNEEPLRKIKMRLISRMSSVRLDDLHHADKAIAAEYIAQGVKLARERGSDNCLFVHGVTSYADVEALIAESEATIVIIDQLRHMKKPGKGAEKVEELEYSARELREIANRRDILGVGVHQAGAEAEGKPILNLNHLDGSKTGVQGAVDVILGVGVTEALRAYNQRMLSICRNKTSGVITHFLCSVDEQTTFIKSL